MRFRSKTDHGQYELEALRRAFQNGINAQIQNVTSGYGEGIGGGRRQTGGVIDRHRLALTTHRHNMSQLPPQWLPVFERLIESGISVLEIGRWILPQVRDGATLWGAGRAFMVLLGLELAKIENLRRGASRAERQGPILDQIGRERRAKRAER